MTIVLAPSTSGSASSGDVGNVFDVVIDGNGYVFSLVNERGEDVGARAQYAYTPTFVPRTNVQGDYGDNQQDFWLTFPQRDWSQGEQQKFARRDEGGLRRYYRGTNIDVETPGQATLRQATSSLTFAASVRALCPRGANQDVIAASATKLFEIDPAGTITDKSAHGLGATPAKHGTATDGTDVYLSTTAAGTVGVRKWDGSSYSTFSASSSDALEFLNNTLFGLRSGNADLVRYDTGGALTSIFTWKQADGGARGGNICRLKAFGGQLLILWSDGPNGPELYNYDGTAPSLIAQFPRNFFAYDITVAFGIVFVSGSHVKISNGTTSNYLTRPAIYYWANGTMGLAWQADAYMTTAVSDVTTASHPSVVDFNTGLVFNDDTRGVLMFYGLDNGGVESIGAYTVAGDTPLLGGSQRMFIHTRNQAGAYMHPDTTTLSTSGTIESSLIDFDSSLDKFFNVLKIDADIPTGASIDLAYQLNGHDSTYTTIVTGAASGTEYDIDETGRSLAYKVTLNKGTASTSPTLRRVQLRASPIQETFALRQYTLNLGGVGGRGKAAHPIRRLNNIDHNKTGQEMADDLIESSKSTTPISITDRFGTFDGIILPDQLAILEHKPGQYIARVTIREV